MHRRPVLVLGLIAILSLGIAHGETFRWKDGKVRKGRIVAEFRDFYYVQLDSELPRFVAVSELEGVLDEDNLPRSLGGQAAAPAFAVDGVVGEVRVLPKKGPAEPVSTRAFGRAGDRIITGDTGIARTVFPAQAIANVGPSSRVIALDDDSVELEQGQLLLTAPERKGFGVTLVRGLSLRIEGGQVETVRAGGSLSWRFAVHSGEAVAQSDSFRLKIPAGHAATVAGTETGIRLTADATNAGTVEVTVGTKRSVLAAGEFVDVEGAALATARVGGTWRLQRIKGGVHVRTAGELGAHARFVQITPFDVERVRLESGDAVQTDAASEAVLVREDGATVTLDETSELAIEDLVLAAGGLRVDALRTPVLLATPGGEARLSLVSLAVRRPRAHDESSLEASVVSGDAKLPLAAALAAAPAGSKLTISGTPEETAIHATAGTVRVLSAAQAESGDPGVACDLAAGSGLTSRALHKDGLALLLEGNRSLSFGPEHVNATVNLDGSQPAVAFQSGAVLSLGKGAEVRFRFEQGAPAACFAGGERVLLAEGLRAALEGTTFTLEDGTTVAFKGAAHAALRPAEGQAGAVLGARRDDRFEVPRGARVVAGRRSPDHATFRVEGGVSLWIDDGAPPVQARLTVGRETGFKARTHADVDAPLSFSFTMPGTPPLTVAATRRVVVLATRAGELVILDDPALVEASADKGLLLLSGNGIQTALPQSPNHLPELLAQPPPASPVR